MCKDIKQKDLLHLLVNAIYHMGEFSLNLNATLCIGPSVITALSLTETNYIGIPKVGVERRN